MITGLNLNEVFDYTIEGDKESPTVWKLGVIRSDLFALLTGEEGDSIKKAYKYLQVSLRGWDNFSAPFRSEEGLLFGEKMQFVPMDILGQIPLWAVNKLAQKIIEINQISETERKN